jgi:CheY-like chemotaxis protein
LLDISLPDFDGWRVLRHLKHDLAVRHIPVYVVSSVDEPEFGLKLGAKGVLRKPVSTSDELEQFLDEVRKFVDRPRRKLVVIGADVPRRDEVARLLCGPSVECTSVGSGASAVSSLQDAAADCIVISSDPDDMSLATLAEQLLRQVGSDAPPIVLYLAGDTAPEARHRLGNLAIEFNLRLVDGLDELVEVSAMAFCQSIDELPDECQQIVRGRHQVDGSLAGKKVLIVDDDIRNIFALTSVLERYDMITVSAETGRDAIGLLQASPDVAIVLMDIMMPEMDGIDTMRAIRQIPRFKDLPIIAVTAKAMKGDREKCFEAGAWDYLSKPVNPEQMLASLGAWLST